MNHGMFPNDINGKDESTMNELFLKIADGFEILAAGYRALAQDSKASSVVPATDTPAAPIEQEAPKEEKPTVTMEQVRAVLAQKSKDGKKVQVKALLLKYDSGKLSGVKSEDYPALLAEAEVL